MWCKIRPLLKLFTFLCAIQTQSVAEKQTAIYTLQRKLKSSRQALESKELHLGLVQKKVVALEDRLQTYSHREADWENTTNKARKIERQLERLQDRASLQRETITKLKAETSESEALRVGTKLHPHPTCCGCTLKCLNVDLGTNLEMSDFMRL